MRTFNEPMTRFNLNYPVKLDDAVEQLSREKNITKNAIIVMAISEYVNTQDTIKKMQNTEYIRQIITDSFLEKYNIEKNNNK